MEPDVFEKWRGRGQLPFGTGADDYLRISYATSMANIEKGLERIEKFVRSLKK